ncbi:MAG: anthranilate synthase component I [Candidatus Abyssobacteria bacterium SURF_17]|uniref:Anthranilate synthase component 1 n=1 Tax=Candidatus Abyssobacteria bacterium SURF_17 TaxID=2093361 RepID=A0A419F305_9BACT|nr:MAG: anthranilate synthase component I [Candidatus Abyssubacteria bacterium SURF_17]
MYTPTWEEFKQKASQGNLIPVYRKVLADLETPVSAFLKIDAGDYSFLLESVEGGDRIAQYSFLGSNPSIIFQSKGNVVTVIENGVLTTRQADEPLECLKQLMQQFKPVAVEGVPRFFGGAVGYVGYDAARFFEKLPDDTYDDIGLPDTFFVITDKILIFDHVNHTIMVVCNAKIEDDPEAAYREATRQIDAMVEALQRPLSYPKYRPPKSPAKLELISNFTREEFEEIVKASKEYIRAGDIFQVVLSQRFSTKVTAPAFDIYRALRSVNPSPYMFYLKFGSLKLVGASPELLVRVEEGVIDLRPIAGTRPRALKEFDDAELERDLLSDEKERAEHIMLVDLGRNDVGRVAKLGSVHVTELMVVEKYSHVMHIVSNVRGTLDEKRDCFDVLRATFPAGTLTGAPKIRAMEIVEELEPLKRGPYGGTMGYFSFSGNLDTCIIIRTLIIKDDMAYVQAGAGIVADSEPTNEYYETLNKALAVVKAIEIAEAGL